VFLFNALDGLTGAVEQMRAPPPPLFDGTFYFDSPGAGLAYAIAHMVLVATGLAFLLPLGLGLIGLRQLDRNTICARLGSVISAAGLVTVIVTAIDSP